MKAQIRLQFRAANKKRVVAVRSFQLTQKEKKAEFKQLEAALLTDNGDGGVQSHSYRCMDMDKLIPELIGVSPAILENVIFCHQEDVNWPLSDSSSLKKKFDDIFASTRYTKALAAIRKLQKEKNDELKDLQVETGKLEERKKQATKV